MQTNSNQVEARTGACHTHHFGAPNRALHLTLTACLIIAFAWSVTAGAQTQPNRMTVTIPTGTNNSAGGTGTFTCSLSGGGLNCSGALDTSDSDDDIFLSTIRFNDGGNVTFDAASGEIIPGLASVFLEGGGGTNVNAEWGDQDDNNDGDDNPFVKAGYGGVSQESTDIDVINATLLQVFRSFNIMEGVDGEDENFRLELIFERGVRDNNSANDSIPEIIVFERGLNSDVAVQLLLADGGVTNEITINRGDFRDAGFNADTVEIAGSQPMGVVGVDLNAFSGGGFSAANDTVIGVRFGSAGDGADIFGVFGTTKNPQPLRDRGDAPASYGTLNADNGPNHLLSRGLFIGLPPDSEPDGQPSADATGDDSIAGNDEALFYQFPAGPFLPGDTFSVTAPVFNQTGANALLCGWVDFNENGVFDNAGAASGSSTNAERACGRVANNLVSTGTNPDTVTLDFVVPADFAGAAGNGGVFARFRITSDWASSAAASPLGAAANGEVEDVLFDVETTPFDYGDLDNVYGTLRSSNGARHVIDSGATLRIGNAVDSEANGQPDGLATGDDNNGSDDEDGVTFPDSVGADFVYTSTVTAANSSGDDALLCGWFDFANDLDFSNNPNTSTTSADPQAASATDSGERSCVLVPAGTSGGTFQVSWTIPESARGNSGLLPFRYRLSTDPAMFAPSTLLPIGSYLDGEVEDYFVEFGSNTLPVSISSFKSRYTSEGLELSWVTVSETHNLGFYVWGDKGDGLAPLTADLVPSEDGDPATPRAYKLVIPGLAKGDVLDLAVTAVDYRGDEEVYGLFEAGARYGKDVAPAAIDWQEIRHQARVREQMHAAESKRAASVRAFGTPETQRPDYVDIRVTEPGLQEVTWQMLADAGMDLTGVAAEDIAITLKGQPVSRHVVSTSPRPIYSALTASGSASERGQRFGPDGRIRFWGTAPTAADAIYVDHYVYRVSVARGAGLAARRFNARTNDLTDSHLSWQRQDLDTGYHFASRLEDPWYAARLRADRNNAYDTQFFVDDALRSDLPARLEVLVAGLTHYPVAPDHRALVEVNGQVVGEATFDGQAVRMMDLEVPAGLLVPGENNVRVLAPGGTDAPFDLFLVDTLALGYPRDLVATEGRLLIESPAPGAGLRIAGVSPRNAIAYGWRGETLYELKPGRASAGSISLPTLDESGASYWISSDDRAIRPEILGAGHTPDLFTSRAADLVVIAHPAFMPLSGNEAHPLNDYIAQREQEGWTVGLYDVTDIHAAYGHGMPLAQAVTAFLQAAERRFDYEHVLLVGGDSYDYTDNLGLGSVSFIPTRYAATSLIPHTPSDALLADLDGDGLADKAVGRWPVRTRGDLEAIVAKTLDWPDLAHPQSSVWMTDSEDARTGSFNSQADRVLATLEDAGWPAETLNRVYFNQTAPRPGLSVADSARDDLFELLEQGRALTGFVGHGAPAMWSFQGMVTPDDLSDLHNEGNPTMIGTMTCYTSYFVSPAGDSVAHRWMNGYRENAAGDRIPGVANGAAAIHGAATLSDYGANETYMQAVLAAQLNGATVGQAVEAARRQAQAIGNDDHVVNWTLLGDPTLELR